jgi:hypothetical protein
VFHGLGLLLVLYPYAFAKGQLATRPHLRDAMTWTFDVSGPRLADPKISGSIEWAIVTRIRETKSALLFYEGAVTARMIPTRVFSNEDALAEFKAAVNKWAAPRSIVPGSIVGCFC